MAGAMPRTESPVLTGGASGIGTAEWFGAGFVVVTGRCDDLEGVGSCLVAPPAELFEIVAGGAQSRGVVPLGFAAAGSRVGMIGVLDGGLAPRRAADVVAEDDHASKQPGEFPAARVHPHELPVFGPSVEPADEGGGLVLGNDGPGGLCRDRADSGEPCRFFPGPEQTAVLHDEVDFSGHCRSSSLPGQSLDQEIRSDLILTSTVGSAGGDGSLRRLLEVGECGDSLRHRQQSGQIRHISRCRTHTDRALLDTALEVVDCSLLIESLCESPHFVAQSPHTHLGQASGHLLVELVLLLPGKPVGFLCDRAGLLLRDVATFHRPVDIGQIQEQGPREFEQRVATVPGDLSG